MIWYCCMSKLWINVQKKDLFWKIFQNMVIYLSRLQKTRKMGMILHQKSIFFVFIWFICVSRIFSEMDSKKIKNFNFLTRLSTVPSSKVLFEYCTVFSLKHERVMYTVPSLYLLRFQHMLMFRCGPAQTQLVTCTIIQNKIGLLWCHSHVELSLIEIEVDWS